MLQHFFNPDTILALVVLVIVVALTLVVTFSGRPNRRMEFFLDLMKDFPTDDNEKSEGGSRNGSTKHPEHSMARNIDI